MSKMLIVAVLAVAALIMGGALEVKFHQDKLAQVPNQVLQLALNETTREKARALFTDLKRQGEMYITKDNQKRLELALLYVKHDAQRLDSLTATTEPANESVLPQAELLLKSLERVREQINTTSVESLPQIKVQAQESFTLAQQSLQQLSAAREHYAALQEQFQKITGLLEEHIGTLPSVAGISTQETDSSTPVASPGASPLVPALPLQF